VAVTPDGSKVYVANASSFTVSVIDTATNAVVGSPIRVGSFPWGLAVTPDGSKVYVANFGFEGLSTVSVIDTATNTVVGLPIAVGQQSIGLAITPDGSKVYVTNERSDTVSVIDTVTNMVVAVPSVGKSPLSFGVFIQPRFAGTRGRNDCLGVSVSGLAQTFGGLNPAAIALGFPTVVGMQTAVAAYCGAHS
jgi:YVTN family beta-propeller protein